MSNFDQIRAYADVLNIANYTDSLARYAYDNNLSEHDVEVIVEVSERS